MLSREFPYRDAASTSQLSRDIYWRVGKLDPHGMSSHQTTDNRTCVDEYMASDGENSDDEIEEALLVERKRETLLRQSQFYTCLSTLDE